MSYTIQVSRKQLERIYVALVHYDIKHPVDKEPKDGSMEDLNIEYLTGCADDTLKELENDTIYCWNF